MQPGGRPRKPRLGLILLTMAGCVLACALVVMMSILNNRLSAVLPGKNAKLTNSEAAAWLKMGAYTEDTAVVFADSEVEAEIRAGYIDNDGDITVGDMRGITGFVDGLGTIYSLFDLRYCDNLETLAIMNQPIKSIEGLRKLPKLKDIVLIGTSVSDLSPLAGKESLTSVTLIASPVPDASPVLGLPSLNRFMALGTHISDISALRKTSGLTEFLCDSKLYDCTPLFGHKNLETISLSGISDEEFKAILGYLGNLTSISIYNSTIRDSSLELLRNFRLKQLVLDNCGIKDISALSSLTTVDDLRLPNNSIEDISPLAGLTQIGACLELQGNPIKDYTPLEGMTRLKSITVTVAADEGGDALGTLEKNGCAVIRK